MSITTGGSGNWSSTTANAPWPGGTLPGIGDAVIIAAGHTVTLDTAAVCLSLSLTGGGVGVVGGKLLNATGANISLTIEQGLANNYVDATAASTRNPTVKFDMSADPTHTLTITINHSASATTYLFSSTSRCTLKGAPKTETTTVSSGALTGGTSTTCNVTDATGWQVGDNIIFATTLAQSTWFTGVSFGSWSGGIQTFNLTSSAGMQVGGKVFFGKLTSAAVTINQGWVVNSVPDGTHITIAMPSPSGSGSGQCFLLPSSDEVTIATLTAVGGGGYSGSGPATITWTGAVVWNHAANCLIGNLSRNILLTGYTASIATYFPRACTDWNNAYGDGTDVINYVAFNYLGGNAAYSQSAFCLSGGVGKLASINSNVFYNCMGYGSVWYYYGVDSTLQTVTRQNNIFQNWVTSQICISGQFTGVAGNEVNLTVFGAANALTTLASNHNLVSPKISGCIDIIYYQNNAAVVLPSVGFTVTNGDFWSNRVVFNAGIMALADTCTFGTKYSGATNSIIFNSASDCDFTLANCSFDSTGATLISANITGNSPKSIIRLVNKNTNTAIQEVYTNQSATVPALQREYAASPQKFTRSTSAMCFTSSINKPITQTENILAENGIAVTIIGYMVTSHVAPAYGASTLPFIKLDGLSITPQTVTYVDVSTGAVATLSSVAGNGFHRSSGSFVTDGFVAGQSVLVEGFASNNGTFTVLGVTATDITTIEATTAESAGGSRAITRWYKATVTATQSSGADGNLTLTLTSQSAVAGAKAWFAGIPFSPFVSRARHYGYLYDETVPTRTVNGAVSASETTAQAYTGMAVAWGSPSPVTISASTTFQKLYDYTQAIACLNVASALPLTGAGVAGNVALFGAANLTINTGQVLNGSGSISVGAFTLATEFAGAIAYSYTGGTWSQAAATPAFSGGTVTLGTAATYPAFSLASGTLTMTATSAAWDFSAGTFTGTLNLRTDTGTRAVTVLVPAGTTVDTTGESSITVNYTTVNQGIAFTGVVSGSQVKIFTTGTQTELYSATAPTYTFSQSYSADITVDYTVMKVGYVPIRVTGVLLQQTVQTTPIQQVADREYVASSGLTFTTNATANTSTNIFSINAATTLQNWYSFIIESWIAQSTLKNKAFPLSSNGPSSYTLGLDWEWRGWATSQTQGTGIANTSLVLLSRGGMRYVATAGTVNALWSGLLTLGTAAGLQVKYRQTTSGTVYSANNTGPMDQVVQVFGTASYGSFDDTGHLVLKIEKVGYTQAKSDVVATYGTLADQFYVASLAPTLVFACTNADLDATHLVLDNTAKTYVISAAHTMADLYQRAQWWANQDAQWDSDVPLTTPDGSTYTQPSTWTTSGPSYLTGGGTIAGGTITLDGPGSYTTGFNGATVTAQGEGTYGLLATSSIVTFAPTANAVTYYLQGGTFGGTIDLRNTHATRTITVELPSGTSYTTASNTGAAITVTFPVVTQGIDFSGLIAGSQVKVYTTATQTALYTDSSSGTTSNWNLTYVADKTVDYTILKAGYLPIRVTGVLASTTVLNIGVQQVLDREYVASSGLSYGTTATVNTGTSRFAVTTATTVQNWYSFMIESWIAQSALANVQFPLSTNGPSSYTLGLDWEWASSASIAYLYRDGMRYVSSAGALKAVWAGVFSSGVPTGFQVHYQQSNGGTTQAAANTGNIDQLIQVYGDASHGNYDYRSWLVLKVQHDGYDQAVADVYSTYGALQDQLYVVGLAPTNNGLATGNPTVSSVTITDHGASPVTWHGKQFSVTITNAASPYSGTLIQRWLRYNYGLGGTFQSADAFDWPDLTQTNGTNFKTVRQQIYGDAGATLKGVRVVQNDGTTAHPDFNLFTADDGTTYAPPATATITISGPTAGSRIQLWDLTNSVELYNGKPSFPYTYSETYASDKAIRLRVAYCAASTANLFIDTAIGSITSTALNLNYLVAPVTDTVYAANLIDGTAITDCSIVTTNLHVDINAGSTSWQHIYAFMVYWLSTAIGIADQYLEMTATDQTHYTFSSQHGGNFKIKNVTSPSVPLLITGGNAQPDTGAATDILDTTGGTIFCIEATVVPFTTSSQAVNLSTVQAGIDSRFGFSVPGNVDANLAFVKGVAAAVTVPGHPDANISHVHGTSVNGDGTAGSPWGP